MGSYPGSDPDYSMGQWVIQVSDIDPVPMLRQMAFQLYIVEEKFTFISIQMLSN